MFKVLKFKFEILAVVIYLLIGVWAFGKTQIPVKEINVATGIYDCKLKGKNAIVYLKLIFEKDRKILALVDSTRFYPLKIKDNKLYLYRKRADENKVLIIDNKNAQKLHAIYIDKGLSITTSGNCVDVSLTNTNSTDFDVSSY